MVFGPLFGLALCVALWPCDLVALRLYGLVALWPCCLIALLPCCFVVVLPCNLVSLWLCSFVVWRLCLAALWPCGLVALWPRGIMALWPWSFEALCLCSLVGFVALWAYVVVIATITTSWSLSQPVGHYHNWTVFCSGQSWSLSQLGRASSNISNREPY